MNWEKYFKEKNERKRWEMLEKDNRLSYDHVDNWIMSVSTFLLLKKKEKVVILDDNPLKILED